MPIPSQNNNNNDRFTALCLGLPGWAGTRRNTHPPPSWSSSNLYQLLPSTTIHSIFLFKLRDWQSFCTTSFHVLFGLPLGLEPSLHVVNQQKVCLLPEVFKPSMAVYDTVVECHRMVWLNKRWMQFNCRHESYMCGIQTYITQISVINLTQLTMFTNSKCSRCASVKLYCCQRTAAELWRRVSAIDIGWVNWRRLHQWN